MQAAAAAAAAGSGAASAAAAAGSSTHMSCNFPVLGLPALCIAQAIVWTFPLGSSVCP